MKDSDSTSIPASKIDQRVEAELAAVKKNANGHRVVSVADLEPLAVETHLVLLLEAGATFAPIEDDAVLAHLSRKYYADIHASKGGLAWDAWNKYGRGCKRLAEAAERHRAHIGSFLF